MCVKELLPSAQRSCLHQTRNNVDVPSCSLQMRISRWYMKLLWSKFFITLSSIVKCSFPRSPGADPSPHPVLYNIDKVAFHPPCDIDHHECRENRRCRAVPPICPFPCHAALFLMFGRASVALNAGSTNGFVCKDTWSNTHGCTMTAMDSLGTGDSQPTTACILKSAKSGNSEGLTASTDVPKEHTLEEPRFLNTSQLWRFCCFFWRAVLDFHALLHTVEDRT